MCGIAGLIDNRLSQDKLGEVVTSMMCALHHRGPDGDGHWTDGEQSVGLGHRRLAIIDLTEKGRQPMVSASGRYILTYNGEIYNFLELRDDLIAQGIKFDGDSDSEVLLALIDSQGVSQTLQQIAGMFAFAVWDRQEHELHLVVDRLGIKPIYWCADNGRLSFASELKSLHEVPGFDPEISRHSLAKFLRYSYIPAPETIFLGVNKLAPGSHLVWSMDQSAQIDTYWSAVETGAEIAENRHDWSNADAKSAFSDTLGHVIDQHMISDVSLGAFLSGGIDSTLVVAMMQARSSRPVKTFTMGFEATSYDEAPHARKIAQHLGTDHTEAYVSNAQAREMIPFLSFHYDEPFADSSQIPTMLVSKMAKKEVTVALVGDGGDELFAGYDRYHWAARVMKLKERVPGALVKAVGGSIGLVPSQLWNILGNAMPSGKFSRAGERVERLLNMMKADDIGDLYARQLSYGKNPASFVKNLGECDTQLCVPEELWSNSTLSLVEKMQLADLSMNLPGDMLTKVDRASMSVSLEVRVPLLDHRVVEMAMSLPPQMSIQDGDSKWLLRQLIYNYVPKTLIDRPKRGFRIPIGPWLKGPLSDWVEGLISEERLRREGWFHPERIRQLWEDFKQGRASVDQLWSVLMFQSWLDKWNAPAKARND